MKHNARGTFEVKLATSESPSPDVGLRSIDKRFQGDLTAISKGVMIATGAADGRFAAYSALEVVDGSLAGRSGTFVLQHRGAMLGTQSHLDVTVVAGSGTGDLSGLRGTMRIVIAQGSHSYEFDYSLDQDDKD